MPNRKPPAVDPAIEPLNGVTRDGQPLSYNRAPAEDLRPWIARVYATAVDLPPGHRLDCGLFNDTTMIRIQLKGDWTAETADGLKTHNRAAVYIGPQTRRMPVSVTGSFISVGLSLRPGTGFVVLGTDASDYVDRLLLCDDFGLPAELALAALEQHDTPEGWLQTLEAIMRQIIAGTSGALPDPISTRFEALAFSDPTASVAEFARECGIGQRRLERIVRRDFGMPPKQVLRRARALDMASHLRGVADSAEADELALRFYDQSHLIREFTALFGMSPRQFAARPQPIMTLALESRQARRLEVIERLVPGEPRPWQ